MFRISHRYTKTVNTHCHFVSSPHLYTTFYTYSRSSIYLFRHQCLHLRPDDGSWLSRNMQPRIKLTGIGAVCSLSWYIHATNTIIIFPDQYGLSLPAAIQMNIWREGGYWTSGMQVTNGTGEINNSSVFPRLYSAAIPFSCFQNSVPVPYFPQPTKQTSRHISLVFWPTKVNRVCDVTFDAFDLWRCQQLSHIQSVSEWNVCRSKWSLLRLRQNTGTCLQQLRKPTKMRIAGWSQSWDLNPGPQK